MRGSRGRQNIRDVAALAGVSVGTVSNVLNRPELVSGTTRERVNDAIGKLGFVRNGAARALRVGESRVVGALVLDIANPYFTDVARGMEDRLDADGRLLMLGSSDSDLERSSRQLSALREQDLHGLVVTPIGPLAELSTMLGGGTPVVLLDRDDPELQFCSVSVDGVTGGRLAGEHLLEGGHRRIAFINGPHTTQACLDRSAGLRGACQQAHLDPDDVIVEITVRQLNSANGEAAATTIPKQHPDITAIACINDLVALGALRALAEQSVSVPGDIAVIGYDDVDFAASLATPLSTIRQPRYEIGRAAAQLLLDEATEGVTHVHKRMQFQPELVVRASSRAC
jgi:LacI family transcriptional regulator